MKKKHPLAASSTLAGAASGVVVGSIAGPPGAAIGGVVGTAVGLLAGAALERTEQEADAHDAELDAILARPADADSVATLSALLRAEHLRLEDTYELLLTAYRSDDWNRVELAWNRFEPELRAHMEHEETRLFPLFREVDRDETELLLAEHAALRERLDLLAVNIELHAVSRLDAEDLIQGLRAHRAREEQLLYPWTELGLEPSQG